MITFLTIYNKSAMGANNGVAIVNIHSGGDTDDTVIRVVVVTAVGSSDISGESVRDFFSKQSYEHATARRYSGNVQEIHTTGCGTSHLHGGSTAGSRSDDTTTFGHLLARRPLCENARADKSYPVTKRVVAYQQGAHVQYDVQRDSEMELDKRRGRATPERRCGESRWRAVRRSERRYLLTEKCH